MENYAAKHPNRRAAPWPIFLILAVLVAGGAFLFIHHNNEETEVTTAQAPPPQQPPQRQSRLKTPERPSLVPPKATVPQFGTTSGSGTVQTTGVSEIPAATAEPKDETPSMISVDFDLATRDVMGRMSQEGEGRLDVGTYSVSVVPNFKSKYDNVRVDAGFSLLGSENRNLKMGQPTVIFVGGKEPQKNEPIGFLMEITPLKMSDRGLDLKISIKRTLPDATTGELKLASQDFDNSITVPRGWGIVMGGLLPRKPLLEGEDKLYEANILKALLDPSFQKGDTEFLIVLSPQ